MSRTILGRRVAAFASIVAAAGLLAAALPAAAWDGDREDANITAQITNVGLGAPGADERVVPPGASVAISFDYVVTNIDLDNFMAIKYGWSSEAKPRACTFINKATTGILTGSASATINAPSVAGSTYLRWELVENSCSGALTNPWTSGPVATNPEDAFLGRLFVRNKLVTASSVTISGVTMTGGLTDVEALPGDTITVSLSAKIDGRSCPTCRYRILVGWSDSGTPSRCIYNGKPLGAIKTITRTFDLVVPANPIGLSRPLDRFIAFKAAKSGSTTCNQSSWPGGSPNATPETSFLGHVKVTAF